MPLHAQEPSSLSRDFPSFDPELSDNILDYPLDDEFPEDLTDFVAAEEAGGDELPAGTEEEPIDFYENLAEYIDEKTLDTLASEIVEGIENDKQSRSKWEKSLSTIIKYLGWEIEDYENKLCSAYDNTLSTTLMNFFAVIKSELLPPSGPAKSVAQGITTEETIEIAERLAIFFNVFLTTMDKVYYPDRERLILYVGLFGLAFTKVFQDPISNRPSARLVKPQDLIINNECTSILESSRITHAIQLTKKDILLKERNGIYLKGTLKNSSTDDDNEESSEINKTISDIEGVSKDSEENKYLIDFYESHVELSPSMLKDRHGFSDLEDDDDIDNIPRPYIVDIRKSTGKIRSIKRNWDENDDKFKRMECFVEWHFLPGLGMYSNGLCQLIGSNAIVLTNTLRQTLDALAFGNFPGGFIRKGAQPDENNLTVYPGQFKPIDTDDKPILEVFSTLPFSGPSPIAIQIRSELKADTSMLGGAAQQATPMGNSEAPVGTTLANIEIRDRFPSNILQSFIMSMTYEFELLKGLFKDNIINPYIFDIPGKQYQVSREDFEHNINIMPIADPNLSTKSQRIVINELLIRIARENPGTVDLKEAVRRLIKSMNVEDIDKLMPKPEEIMPLDPVTENVNLINGKGARAGIQQDHKSHILAHSSILQVPAVGQDPMKAAAVQAHVSEHQAFAYLVEMQTAMGMQMPDAQALQDPQVQNQIAMMAAEATKKIQEQQQAQNPPPPNPAMVMMEDIKQKREASLLKHEEAKLRAETEAFKVQTQFESSQNKMDVEKEVAKDRNETSLTIEKMKQRNSE